MRFAIALFFALLPAHLDAQTVRVQSGDHQGYTRLAVLFDTLPDWRFGRVDGGYELQTGQTSMDFDLTGLFRRIGRNRIEQVEVLEGGRLFIAVSCACNADIFTVAQALVIDIRDGPAAADAAFDQPLLPIEERAPDVAVAPVPEMPTIDLSSPFSVLEPVRTIPLRTEHAWQDSFALDLEEPTPEQSPPPVEVSDVDPALQERLAEMQADLLAQISRATGQGMLEADSTDIDAVLGLAQEEEAPPEVEFDAPEPEPDQPLEPASADEDSGLDALASLSNVNIETAIDRGQTNSAPSIPQTENGESCIANDALDLATWGSTPEKGTGLGTYRSQILGEFDAADPEVIAGMARNYLYLTFGLEARVLIEAFEAKVPSADMYLVLAEIMDEGVASEPGPFEDQLACPTRASLWAALARPALSTGDSVATPSILSSFSELPLHLRRHLGPWLVERFLGIGDTDSANVLRNALARAPVKPGEELRMIDADIAMQTGEITEATRALDRVVEEDGTRAPDALISLIDTLVDAGQPVSSIDRDNAAALAFVNRGTALGAELKRVHIRALAQEGAITEALDELELEAAMLSGDVVEDLRLEIFTKAVDDAPQELFLKTVLPGPVDLGQTDDGDQIRRAIAERLINMGLTEAARAQMNDDETLPTEADRLLFARAFLLEERPDLVIGYLAGLEGKEAKMMLAKAHELAGEYVRAAAVYREIDDDAARIRATWRGEDWSATAEIAEGPQSEAAALAAIDVPAFPDTPSPETGPGPLTVSRSLLDQSTETRRILEDLLATTPALQE